MRCGPATACPLAMTCDHGLCRSGPEACPAGDFVEVPADGGSDATADDSSAFEVAEGEGMDAAVQDGMSRPDASHDLDSGTETGPDLANDAVADSAAVEGGSADAPTSPVDAGIDAAQVDAKDGSDVDTGPCPAGTFRNLVTQQCVRAHDLNGDGRADLVTASYLGMNALLSDGRRFNFVPWFSSFAFYGYDGVHFADVTGDGPADAVVFGDGVSSVLRFTGVGFALYQEWLAPTSLVGSRGNYLANVDGDPDDRSDAISVREGAIAVALSTGGSFLEPSLWLEGDLSSYLAFYFADVDGDGKADAIGLAAESIVVALSTGTGFGDWNVWYDDAFVGAMATFIADVNGDGMADAVRLDTNQITVALSEGRGFQQGRLWYAGSLAGMSQTFLADVNADGRADVVSVNATTVTVALSTGNDFAPPTLWYSTSLGMYDDLEMVPEAAAPRF